MDAKRQDLHAIVEEIARLERGACARCERRARAAAVGRWIAVGAATVLVGVVWLWLAFASLEAL